MIAVSNTTPLRYLIAIEQEQLFSGVFEKVFVPLAVHEELTKMATPERVRNVIRSLPSWYEVRKVRSSRGTKFARYKVHLWFLSRQRCIAANDNPSYSLKL